MKRFRVMLRASGLVRLMDGQPERLGVYAVHFVAARDQETAESLTCAWLKERLKATASLTPRSRFQLESCELIPPAEVPATQPGLTWFRETT